eukprot:gene9967-13407_t
MHPDNDYSIVVNMNVKPVNMKNEHDLVPSEENDHVEIVPNPNGNDVNIEEGKNGSVKKSAEKLQNDTNTYLHYFGFRGAQHDPDEDATNIPKLSYFELFTIFCWFGCRAFGGPVAQIALMKQELVTEKKWITEKKFNKIYGVYQILPGPEATEIACYFGYVSKGRIGAFLGGLGFVLPGLLGMLLCGYLYTEYGLDNKSVKRSFQGVQSAVAAMIFRAIYKLAEGALKSPKTKAFSWDRGFIFMFNFLTAIIGLNFFISLAVSGVMNTIFENEKIPYRQYVNYFIAACTIGFFILYVELNGIPSGSLVGDIGSSTKTTYEALFVLGLIAGCVTFGGAYTTLPFIYQVAVVSGKWLTQQQFLDSIAITNMMPTPLVTFVTIVGFVGKGIGGSILMNIGIFLPAFSFTIIGHEVFEAMVENIYIEPFFEGISSAVIGLLLQTAFQFVKATIVDSVDTIVFLLSFAALFHFTDRYTQPIIIIVAAIAGQALY